MERLGVENASLCPEIIKKINESKKKNGTTNTSAP
jgi:hypothetical protein